MTEERDRQIVQAVVRAIELLEIISREQPIGISELARLSSLKKTTAARLVSTLERMGMVEQDQADHRFSLTLQVFEMGSRVLQKLDVRNQARPDIERFVNKEGKSVLLSILNHDEIVYVDKVEAQELFRIRTMVGGRAPIHCSASGKAILAFLEPELRLKLLESKPLKAYTPKSITDIAALEEDFRISRERGYALDWEERHAGLCAVGAPVFDYNNRVVASISVPRMAALTTEDELAKLGEQVSLLAQEVSKRLGWLKGNKYRGD